MLKRKIYDRLVEWKEKSNGSSALLIDGARRVGKSFIAKEFAEKEYRSHIIVDFGNAPQDILDLFLNDSSNPDLFFAKLSTFYSTPLFKRESLIVFDEVQQFPRARQLIKYLVADGRYDYLETGSLIRLKQNVKDIIIPSEEDHIEMFPLDFEEFLWAMGDTVTVPMLKQCFESKTPLGQALHRKIMNDFRQYVLVGGMPQSVLAYLNEKDFEVSDTVKRRILKLYRDDVSKFAAGYEDKVFAVFDGIPGQLSKKEKKYKLSSIHKDARFRTYEDSFLWLQEAMVVNTCFNATDPNIGLALSADHATQKCYMADTGLLVTHTFMDNSYTENELYRAILFDRLNINEGMIMENVVAQMLRRNGHKLYFYSRSDAIQRENHMEIDFLIAEGKKIAPIEVKSNNYTSHASLDKFRNRFSKVIGNAYILYSKDILIKDGITHLPFYMAMFL
ncbi:MAG: ATP-binding protein [Lachnospiraceae bacterium]|nr:ATP-binding protein [Lachnospiraceae bacterium]MBQ8845950.1 ATP-binding protein [Lachnospiraceae bacterium]